MTDEVSERSNQRWPSGLGRALSLRQHLLAGVALGALVVTAYWLGLAWFGVLVPDAGPTLLLLGLVGTWLGVLVGWLILRRVERRITDLTIYVTALARGDTVAPLGAGSGGLGELVAELEKVAVRLAERARQVRDLGAHASRLDAPLREAAAQEERNRLARDLHDTIKQQLFSIGVTAAAAEARWEPDPAGARVAVGEIRALASEAQVEMRALLTQLRPAPVATIGLLAALREQLDALAYRAEVAVEADLRPLPEGATLAPGAEDALFRIAQEGLANIARHARARHVWVSFGLVPDPQRGEPGAELRLRDDGLGFAPGAANDGMGVANMRARAAELAGSLALNSVAGRGTELVVRVPLYQTPAFAHSEEGIPVAEKERSLRRAVILRIISATMGVGFLWAVIVVGRLGELPGWKNLVVLGLLCGSLGPGIAAEALARRFRQVVGDAPEWRARLDRAVALIHLPEYFISSLLAPEMLRLVFANTPYPWLGDLLGLVSILFLAMAGWAVWELLQAERILTRAGGPWTMRAALEQERSRQGVVVSLAMLAIVGVAALTPGEATLLPDTIADVVRTTLVTIATVPMVIALVLLTIAAARLWWREDGTVTE